VKSVSKVGGFHFQTLDSVWKCSLFPLKLSSLSHYVGAHGHSKVEPHAVRSEVLERMQMVDGFARRCVCLYLFFRSYVYEGVFIR
jgi:hypothetical protein